jgi:hypothetical protein
MHPFLNTKDLTDDQLLEKIMKCKQTIAYQSSLGHMDAVDSIEQILDSLILEQQNRQHSTQEAEINKKNPTRYDPIDVGYCDKDPYE